jgi:hypothetical protein
MAEMFGMPFNFKRMVHFPDRHVSYMIETECSDEEFKLCERQVHKLLRQYAPGQEPEELEVHLADGE